ncbi:prephenate/arogenate dehydrogenase [Pseudanabaena sp. UWO311]|uniref:prephenate/arogenate dehydrogenase n=1 Tax=Pseudanabaena sp. UWO311 TaxID=2487337 RepID=UPI0011595F16|nr:prephenate/arogenate dehydrogenase [Pseudanabaena sp. UWO311]TYQ29069.1 prephenate/arogenate dehydrogenase [Pseudanabaena sp. UWO311]
MNIGIVGLGLIGGSLGLDLLASSQGHNYVWGISRNPDTCKQAEAIAAVNIADIDIENIPDRILAQTDIVVICTPIASILSTITLIAPKLPANVIFTDVGSVKSAIVEPASKICQQFNQRFVGSHTMAGTAFQGISAAEKDLFQNRPCVVTPSNDIAAVEKVRSLWQSVGMNVFECSPEEHDRAVAIISHAPVMISASLIAACQAEGDQTVLKLAQNLASSGFRDTSRVGGGNPELGRLMAEYNQSAVLRSLHTYQQSLQEVISLIENKQWEELEAFLANTQRDRSFYVD